MNQPKKVTCVNTYDSLAGEYYDSARHPTCKNLRDASANILLRLFAKEADLTNACEIGAGFSLMAEICVGLFGNADGILVSDASIQMLEHSRPFIGYGAHLLVAEAERLPFTNDSMNLMVSVLGDCYNTDKFWREIARVLEPQRSLHFYSAFVRVG